MSTGVYIKGMEMPKNCEIIIRIDEKGEVYVYDQYPTKLYKAIPVPPHGRLIDADALRAKMYHDAFETDSPLQKWDGGCWIRYKMFEDNEENAPTVIPADKDGEE